MNHYSKNPKKVNMRFTADKRKIYSSERPHSIESYIPDSFPCDGDEPVRDSDDL